MQMEMSDWCALIFNRILPLEIYSHRKHRTRAFYSGGMSQWVLPLLGIITVTGFLSSFRLWEVQNCNCGEPVPSKYCETIAIPANLSNAATLGGLLSLLWHERGECKNCIKFTVQWYVLSKTKVG